MNSRIFTGRQNSAPRPTRLLAPMTSIATQASSSDSGKHVALDRSSGAPAPLCLVGEDALLRQKALDEIKQGNHAAAIALFSSLIERNPQNVTAHNNRGLLYVHSGHFDSALADYNTALRLNPRSAKIYNNRANCYASMGRPMEALFDYEMALDLNPANTHARINQGITFRELAMYEHAIETFDLALQFDQMLSGSSTTDTASTIVGHIYAQRGRTSHLAGDWNYAVADYRRALSVLTLKDAALLDVSRRLRLQVKQWLRDLLNAASDA